MKHRCYIEQKAPYCYFAVLFSALALLLAFVRIQMTDSMELAFLYFEKPDGLDLFLFTWLPLLSALVMLIVSLLYCAGKSPRLLLLSGGLFLAETLCRYGVTLYRTLYVHKLPFDLTSPPYVDVLGALLVSLLLLLTLLSVLRTHVPLVAVAFSAGILAVVFSVAAFSREQLAIPCDLSGMLRYLCLCCAIAMNALHLTWSCKQTGELSIPVQEDRLWQQAVSASQQELLEAQTEEAVAQDQDTSELPADSDAEQQTLPEDAQPDVPEEKPHYPLWPPVAPRQEESAQAPARPLPQEGCIWQSVGHDANGVELFVQQRIYYDVKTGRQVMGPRTDCYYPHAPEKPAATVAPPRNDSAQTRDMLLQLEKLHQAGILTDDEYRAKCRQLLQLP